MEDSNRTVDEIKQEHRQNLQYLVNHSNDEEARQRYRESLKRLLESHEWTKQRI